MSTGARIDAWLLRHGVWFMPSLLAGLAVALAAVLAWQRHVGDAETRAAVSFATGLERAPAHRAGTPVPAADAGSAEPVPVLTPARPAGPPQVQVCAVGWVDAATADGGPDLAAVAAAPAVERGRRAIARMLAAAAGDDDAQRATGLLAAAAAASGAERRDALQALANLAAGTRDGRAYAAARRACVGEHEASRPAACAALGLAQWARLDDGNAVPWLHLLADALERRDAAARDEALYRIAGARRVDERPYAAVAAITDVAARDDAGTVAAWTLGAGVLDAAGRDRVPYGAVSVACGEPPLAGDANRASLCGAAADVLIDRSDTLDAHLAGLALAESLGRDTSALTAAAGRARAARDAAESSGWDCGHLRRDLARWQEGAAAGQLALLAGRAPR